VRAGHEVKGNDLRKTETAGVAWSGSAAEAAAGAEAVFTSLPGPTEVEALAPALGGTMAEGADQRAALRARHGTAGIIRAARERHGGREHRW
jgi:3-hydroxyisobutyrate dehydrogenase-like beta-hydroxyacid dehydrogenase